MKYILFIITILFLQQVNAQSIGFEIKGTLVSKDDDDKLPLESATVYLERKKDSTVVSYTITDEKGAFFLEGKTKDKELNFNITYIGFKSLRKSLDLTKGGIIDMKEILLKPDANELNEVVIRLTPPIVVKKDTLEFNVRSFKTKKDANVEDLIKVLPGAEVDAEGNITVNGKPVNKVLINGKPFFGSDPTIATRNFPKDIIEKVQVLDSKTKSQAFTGEDSDGENKTINLVIKKENNKGVFGRAAAGIGTNGKYEYAGMYNHFDNDQKISVLLGGNNVNSPGFSFGEIREMFIGGDGNRAFSGGQGIVTSDNAGLNYADNYGKNVEFSSNYFYAGSDSENKSSRERENILSDGRFYTDSNSSSFSSNDNHSVNFEIDIKKDTMWLFNISPSFKFSKSTTTSNSNENSFNGDRELINESTSSSDVVNDSKNMSTGIDITRRYGSKGGFVRLGTDVRISALDTEDFLLSQTNITSDSSKNTSRNQYATKENSSQTLGASFTYRMPIISKELFLDLGYSYNRNKNNSDKRTYDYNESSQEFDTENLDLSTDYTNIDESHVPKIGVNYTAGKIRLRLTSSYRFRTLENEDDLRPIYSLKRQFNNLEQNVDFRYRFSQKSSFNLRYNLRNNPPNLSYLQAFEDVSDPLNTVIGNPNLSPEKNHNINISFNNFNFQKRTGLYGFISGEIIKNQTISKTSIDSVLIKQTTFTNVDGNYRILARIGASKKIQFTDLTSLDVRLRAGPGFNRIVNYNNDVFYVSKVLSFSPSLGLRYEWRDVMDLETMYIVSYTNNQYDLSSLENQNFTYHKVSVSTTSRIPKGVEWSNSIDYNYNPNVSDGFQKSSWFWNMSLSYSVLKDKGLISLKAYDLLNQNTNARRVATQNYIQDSQSTVLKQYFMVGFSWKFNTLGDRGKGGRRGRGGNRGGGERRRR